VLGLAGAGDVRQAPHSGNVTFCEVVRTLFLLLRPKALLPSCTTEDEMNNNPGFWREDEPDQSSDGYSEALRLADAWLTEYKDATDKEGLTNVGIDKLAAVARALLGCVQRANRHGEVLKRVTELLEKTHYPKPTEVRDKEAFYDGCTAYRAVIRAALRRKGT
jgi:hypothetical protein